MSLWGDIDGAWHKFWGGVKQAGYAAVTDVKNAVEFASQALRHSKWLMYSPIGLGYLAISRIMDALADLAREISHAMNRYDVNVMRPYVRAQMSALTRRLARLEHAFAVHVRDSGGDIAHLKYLLAAVVPGWIASGDKSTLATSEQYTRAYTDSAGKALTRSVLGTVDSEAASGYREKETQRVNDLRDIADIAKVLGKVLGEDDPLFAVAGTLLSELDKVFALFEKHTGPRSLEQVVAAIEDDLSSVRDVQKGLLKRITAAAWEEKFLAYVAWAGCDPVSAADDTVRVIEPITSTALTLAGDTLKLLLESQNLGGGPCDIPGIIADALAYKPKPYTPPPPPPPFKCPPPQIGYNADGSIAFIAPPADLGPAPHATEEWRNPCYG